MSELGDVMKKKKFILLSLLLIGFCVGLFTFFHIPKTIEKKNNKEPEIIEIEPVTQEVNYQEIIQNFREKYNNNDIVAILEMPGILEEVVVQTDNNDYYLHYDATHTENIIGATFLDYRNHIRESKKLLIYGHSDPEGQLPFVQLKNYNHKEYWEDHKYIYLLDEIGRRKYEVFSSYIESKDFDYVNLESFGKLTYQEHLKKLQKKSFVYNQTELTEDTKILLLQTCSFDERVKSDTKFQIVIAKEIED